ncbi:hypothetical protein C8Q74DRAFT_862907 [Fomes fomentarius]|nr:hypothetical protein C8Q74DRAFT_862907 [Fomes fomentarius]
MLNVERSNSHKHRMLTRIYQRPPVSRQWGSYHRFRCATNYRPGPVKYLCSKLLINFDLTYISLHTLFAVGAICTTYRRNNDVAGAAFHTVHIESQRTSPSQARSSSLRQGRPGCRRITAAIPRRLVSSYLHNPTFAPPKQLFPPRHIAIRKRTLSRSTPTSQTAWNRRRPRTPGAAGNVKSGATLDRRGRSASSLHIGIRKAKPRKYCMRAEMNGCS